MVGRVDTSTARSSQFPGWLCVPWPWWFLLRFCNGGSNLLSDSRCSANLRVLQEKNRKEIYIYIYVYYKFIYIYIYTLGTFICKIRRVCLETRGLSWKPEVCIFLDFWDLLMMSKHVSKPLKTLEPASAGRLKLDFFPMQRFHCVDPSRNLRDPLEGSINANFSIIYNKILR